MRSGKRRYSNENVLSQRKNRSKMPRMPWPRFGESEIPLDLSPNNFEKHQDAS
jgi:hypothetical protein